MIPYLATSIPLGIIPASNHKCIIADESWVIMDPILPHLSWLHDWDKCERLRRGLAEAFVKFNWPVSILTDSVQNSETLRTVIKSARRVDGGEYYFREFRSIY